VRARVIGLSRDFAGRVRPRIGRAGRALGWIEVELRGCDLFWGIRGARNFSFSAVVNRPFPVAVKRRQISE
jgi:hypothetical protein